jgi:hypothetical protein
MTSSGYPAFDWAKGANLNIDLGPFQAPWSIHIAGKVVCGPLYTG